MISCRLMGVSRGSYYTWRLASQKRKLSENQKLIALVKRLHKKSKESYGTRRMANALRKHGVVCGRARARTLMKLAGVKACYRRKFRRTTNSKHNLPVAQNLLDRNFDVSAPNRVWVGDITYIWTREGWLYLAAVLDLFSRRLVGWSIGKRINKQLVTDALRMAVWRRRPLPGLLFQSDRGSQYCSHKFQKELRKHKMICSMSRKGDCWDNSVMERFFGSLKRECVWQTIYATRSEARKDIVNYIEMFYNSKRSHSYLGYQSPMEFEERSVLKKVA